ncbi:MAG: aminotransferase class III-fold pyridoxal phosphate-dependent enzyme [bacterium]|nr:aminotransferase class III-fold pyridoxal phosphate-dependent enzyme [bacterium]
MVIERGEGCYVWDTDGNEYLDGLAGLFCTNLGHGRSDLAAATAEQLDKLGFYPNWGFAHPSSVEAASLVTAVAPGGLDRVFFVSSGSEAVESAVKFARCYHLANGDEGCYKVIARHWLLLRPGTDARPRLGRRTQRRRGRRSAARGAPADHHRLVRMRVSCGGRLLSPSAATWRGAGRLRQGRRSWRRRAAPR